VHVELHRPDAERPVQLSLPRRQQRSAYPDHAALERGSRSRSTARTGPRAELDLGHHDIHGQALRPRRLVTAESRRVLGRAPGSELPGYSIVTSADSSLRPGAARRAPGGPPRRSEWGRPAMRAPTVVGCGHDSTAEESASRASEPRGPPRAWQPRVPFRAPRSRSPPLPNPRPEVARRLFPAPDRLPQRRAVVPSCRRSAQSTNAWPAVRIRD